MASDQKDKEKEKAFLYDRRNFDSRRDWEWYLQPQNKDQLNAQNSSCTQLKDTTKNNSKQLWAARPNKCDQPFIAQQILDEQKRLDDLGEDPNSDAYKQQIVKTREDAKTKFEDSRKAMISGWEKKGGKPLDAYKAQLTSYDRDLEKRRVDKQNAQREKDEQERARQAELAETKRKAEQEKQTLEEKKNKEAEEQRREAERKQTELQITEQKRREEFAANTWEGKFRRKRADAWEWMMQNKFLTLFLCLFSIGGVVYCWRSYRRRQAQKRQEKEDELQRLKAARNMVIGKFQNLHETPDSIRHLFGMHKSFDNTARDLSMLLGATAGVLMLFWLILRCCCRTKTWRTVRTWRFKDEKLRKIQAQGIELHAPGEDDHDDAQNAGQGAYDVETTQVNEEEEASFDAYQGFSPVGTPQLATGGFQREALEDYGTEFDNREVPSPFCLGTATAQPKSLVSPSTTLPSPLAALPKQKGSDESSPKSATSFARSTTRFATKMPSIAKGPVPPPQPTDPNAQIGNWASESTFSDEEEDTLAKRKAFLEAHLARSLSSSPKKHRGGQ